MQTSIKEYLEEVRSHLHLPSDIERQILAELYTHFQEKVNELKRDKMGGKEASRKAIESFGRAKVISRLMYEAHSKGSWTDVFLTCLPHVIVAGLFLTDLWNHLPISFAMFALIEGVTLFGWWHGKPNWLYSWIGYSLLPLLIVGYLLRFIPAQFISLLKVASVSNPYMLPMLLVAIFYFLSIWLIVSTTTRVIKRDWVLASLMLVPLPIIGCWLVNIRPTFDFWQTGGSESYQYDRLMAAALIVLGFASSVVIRLRERLLKIGALLTLASLSTTIVAYNLWGNIGFFSLIAFALLMLGFLLVPAFLETRIGHGESVTDDWWKSVFLEHPQAGF